MCTDPEMACSTGVASDDVHAGVCGALAGLMVLMLLPFVISCAGSGPSGGSATDGRTTSNRSSDGEVPEEELDQFLEQQQKRRLKPSDNSPGPVMVSFFARRAPASAGVMGRDAGDRSRKPTFRNRAGNDQRQNRNQEQNEYQYLILLSKEWAYEERPVNEPFLEVVHPDVKVMRDWRMNRFLRFLKDNRFSAFPTAGPMSQDDIRNMAPGEKVITYWQGEEYRRVYFQEGLGRRLRNDPAWSGTSYESIQKTKNRLLLGYIRAFNAAGLTQMRVNVGPAPSRKRLDQLADQARPGKQDDLQKELFRAKTLHENGQHRKAKQVLLNVMDRTKGTTYHLDAKALLQSIQQALNEQ